MPVRSVMVKNCIVGRNENPVVATLVAALFLVLSVGVAVSSALAIVAESEAEPR